MRWPVVDLGSDAGDCTAGARQQCTCRAAAGGPDGSASVDARAVSVVRALPEGPPCRARTHGQAPEVVRASAQRERRAGSDRPIAIGPEGECEAELWRINELICRVRKRLSMLTPLSA